MRIWRIVGRGGYAQSETGQLCDQIYGAVQQGAKGEAIKYIAQLISNPEYPQWLKTLAEKIEFLLNNSLDPEIAEDPALTYSASAEVLFLMERLEG